MEGQIHSDRYLVSCASVGSGCESAIKNLLGVLRNICRVLILIYIRNVTNPPKSITNKQARVVLVKDGLLQNLGV